MLLAEVTKTKSVMTKSGIANNMNMDSRGMRAMNSGAMGATWRYPVRRCKSSRTRSLRFLIWIYRPVIMIRSPVRRDSAIPVSIG